jgi:FKBP-type peptidyl-prolyl cis-trans isomerase
MMEKEEKETIIEEEKDNTRISSNKKQKQKTIIKVGLHITDVTATTGLHIEATGIETKTRTVVIHYCLNKRTTHREV